MSGPPPTSPSVTVIVPGRNPGATLAACLAALRAQDRGAAGYEVVYVDDASSDGSAEIAGRWADRVVRLAGTGHGAAAARNAGAALAAGEVLVFIDADVVAQPDTVRELLGALGADSTLAAVFGSYDPAPAHPTLVSQYRNLLHHWVHQQGDGETETFWTGCGAVRRAAFERVGGFDPSSMVEDIELGYRLRAAGMRIRLVGAIQVKHLKAWTLASVLRTDVLARGIPWLRLLRERRRRQAQLGQLNVTRRAIASVAMAWGAVLLAAAAPAWPAAGIAAAGAAGAVVALNAPFYAFLRRTRGLRFAVGATALHFLHHLCNGVSAAVVALESALPRQGRPRGSARGLPPQSASWWR